jgi:L-malate glycosyltransferase
MNRRPSICLAVPILRDVEATAMSQGEVLHRHLIADGYAVRRLLASAIREGQPLESPEWRPDLVVVDVYSGRRLADAEGTALAAAARGLPVILVLRGGMLPQVFADEPERARRLFGRASAVVCPSEFQARGVRRLGFGCRIIPNIIDLPAYPFVRRGTLVPRLFWMRAYDPSYNPAMAIQAVRLIRRRCPRGTLVMAGTDEGFQAEMKQLARSLDLEPHVQLNGFLSFQEKLAEAARADVFINTTNVDNMPVSVLEAWALGLPVVSASGGGIPDMISHGHNGLLVPSGDAAAMADAVCDLVAHPARVEEITRHARESAAASDWAAVRPAWQALFAQVLRAGAA